MDFPGNASIYIFPYFNVCLPETHPQLTTGIIKIMEQRMVAIEQRSAYLHERVNQVTYVLSYLVIRTKFVISGHFS